MKECSVWRMTCDITTLYNNKQETIHSLEEFHEIVAPDSKANIKRTQYMDGAPWYLDGQPLIIKFGRFS